MDLIILAGLGVAFLVALIAIFAGAKTWRWHTILLVLLILVTSALFLYRAAGVLKLHQNWMIAAANLEKHIAEIEGPPNIEVSDRKDNLFLADEMRRLQTEIHRTIAGRGRVWFRGRRASGGPADGMSVTIENPDPHGLEEKTNVYVFVSDEQDASIGTYLGEFRVAAAKPKQVDLVPLFPLRPREANRIKAVAPRDAVTIYESMPSDSHDAFAGLSDEAKRNLFPNLSGTVLEEYLKDGQPAGINDPPEYIEARVKFLKEYPIPAIPGAKTEGPKSFKEQQEVWLPLVGSATVPGAEALIRQGIAEEDRASPRRYVRPLREYKRIFDQAYQDRTLLLASIDQAQRDGEAVRNAVTALEEQTKLVENQGTALAADLEQFKVELTEAQKLGASLQGQLNAVRVELNRVYQENQQLAEQLAALQGKSIVELQKRAGATAAAGAVNGSRIP